MFFLSILAANVIAALIIGCLLAIRGNNREAAAKRNRRRY